MEEAKSDFKRVFRHARAVTGWLIVLLVLLYLASGFYSVKPEQRGVVKHFGRVVTDNVPPGIHYHWPWPVESVVRLRTTEIRSLSISFGKADVSAQQTPEGPAGQQPEASTEQPSGAAVEQQPTTPAQVAVVVSPPALEATALLTGDENLVLTTLLIQYTISQPKHYLYNTNDAEGLLHRIAHSTTIRKYAGMSVDDVLTTGRLEIQQKLKQEIQATADAYGLGVRIASVQIQSIQPPSDVAGAFRDVASAREDKQKLVRQAEGDANRRRPKARAEANTMKSQAEAYTQETVEMAHGDAQRFLAAWGEYRKAKTVTAHRLYMETVEEVLTKVRKVISNPEAERQLAFPEYKFSPDLVPPVFTVKEKTGN
ncbi:MAG: FtsH protease activity modulator HflK [Promethearchaeota archaeon]